MKKVPYSDKLDADQQISTEEKIAAFLKKEIEEGDESLGDDEHLGDLGRDILYLVLCEFRPDLFMVKTKTVKCLHCGGEGTVYAHDESPLRPTIIEDCPDCGGKGTKEEKIMDEEICPKCQQPITEDNKTQSKMGLCLSCKEKTEEERRERKKVTDGLKTGNGLMVRTRDLLTRDVVRVSETGQGFLDAVVIKVEEKYVTLFRPYIRFDDYVPSETTANPLIGREEFTVFRSDSPIRLLGRQARMERIVVSIDSDNLSVYQLWVRSMKLLSEMGYRANNPETLEEVSPGCIIGNLDVSVELAEKMEREGSFEFSDNRVTITGEMP